MAILAANGFEQSELQEPRKALEKAGAKTDLVSSESGEEALEFVRTFFSADKPAGK